MTTDLHPCHDCQTGYGVKGYEVPETTDAYGPSQHPDIWLCDPCRDKRQAARNEARLHRSIPVAVQQEVTFVVIIRSVEPPPGWADQQYAKLSREVELLYGKNAEVARISRIGVTPSVIPDDASVETKEEER
jgi:hypothetical protein